MTNIPKLSTKDQIISVQVTLTLTLKGRINVVVVFFFLLFFFLLLFFLFFNLEDIVVMLVKTKYKQYHKIFWITNFKHENKNTF